MMRKALLAAAILGFGASLAWGQGFSPSPPSASRPAPVSDPNNAAYSAASATYATGATVTAGRAVYLNCSASGSVTMSLSGGGSLAYPVTAGANVLPFAVTSVSADTASCTHQNVN